MNVHKFIVGKNFGIITVNTYIISSKNNSIIIDPGDEWNLIKEHIEKMNLKVNLIICTHCHIDHIKDVKEISDYFSSPVAISEYEKDFLENDELNLSLFFGIKFKRFSPTQLLQDNAKIKIGDEYLEIIHTPGHTPGSICIKGDSFIITGDTLFKNSFGRTDLPGGNYEELINSIKNKLLKFPDNFIVYPGHEENTTIRSERKNFNY